MIELKNLSFAYGDHNTLSNINIKFTKGRLYSVIGPNGSGKTTLIKLISRLLEPESGSIEIDGKGISDYRRKELARKVAILPQSRPTPDMTVQSLVSSGRFPYLGFSGKLTRTDEAIVKKALADTHTAGFAHRNIRELSGGERQRVYLAMLLAQDTPAVLLDEPTTYLDISHQFAVMDILTHMRSTGKCVITVLHDISAALKYSDRVIVMERGNIISLGTPEETVAGGVISKVFGVDCEQIYLKNKPEYIIKGK